MATKILLYVEEEPNFVANDSQSHRFVKTMQACSDARFNVGKKEVRGYSNTLRVFMPYDGWEIKFGFNATPLDSEINPIFYIREDVLHTWEWTDKLDNESQRRLSIVFELICRLAITHDADYIPWVNFDNRRAFVTGLPIHDNIEEPPVFGVYSESVLEQLGGVESFYGTEPWYTARLTSGHTVVIEKPLGPERYDHGWTPPTDADSMETLLSQENVK